MRTVSDLLKMDGRVYVYLCNETAQKKFLADAETEGFRFGDGAKPTERPFDDIYAVNGDRTINFVGFVGHMAFHYPGGAAGMNLKRIDYEKYIRGSEDYIVSLTCTYLRS